MDHVVLAAAPRGRAHATREQPSQREEETFHKKVYRIAKLIRDGNCDKIRHETETYPESIKKKLLHDTVQMCHRANYNSEGCRLPDYLEYITAFGYALICILKKTKNTLDESERNGDLEEGEDVVFDESKDTEFLETIRDLGGVNVNDSFKIKIFGFDPTEITPMQLVASWLNQKLEIQKDSSISPLSLLHKYDLSAKYVLTILLKMGAFSLQANNLPSPFYFTFITMKKESFNFLCSQGIGFSNNDPLPLFEAIESRNWKICFEMLERNIGNRNMNFDPNKALSTKDGKRKLILFEAIKKRKWEAIMKMKDLRVNPMARDSENRLPLPYLELFIKHGYENSTDKNYANDVKSFLSRWIEKYIVSNHYHYYGDSDKKLIQNSDDEREEGEINEDEDEDEDEEDNYSLGTPESPSRPNRSFSPEVDDPYEEKEENLSIGSPQSPSHHFRRRSSSSEDEEHQMQLTKKSSSSSAAAAEEEEEEEEEDWNGDDISSASPKSPSPRPRSSRSRSRSRSSSSEPSKVHTTEKQENDSEDSSESEDDEFPARKITTRRSTRGQSQSDSDSSSSSSDDDDTPVIPRGRTRRNVSTLEKPKVIQSKVEREEAKRAKAQAKAAAQRAKAEAQAAAKRAKEEAKAEAKAATSAATKRTKGRGGGGGGGRTAKRVRDEASDPEDPDWSHKNTKKKTNNTLAATKQRPKIKEDAAEYIPPQQTRSGRRVRTPIRMLV